MTRSRYGADLSAVEARLGARLAAGLGQCAAATGHDISERLRISRDLALQRARAARQAEAGPAASTVGPGPALMLGGMSPWRARLAAALPLLLLVAGLLAIEHWTARERVLAAADIDAQLLTDSLPPSAYTDPGFVEYLRTAPPL